MESRNCYKLTKKEFRFSLLHNEMNNKFLLVKVHCILRILNLKQVITPSSNVETRMRCWILGNATVDILRILNTWCIWSKFLVLLMYVIQNRVSILFWFLINLSILENPFTNSGWDKRQLETDAWPRDICLYFITVNIFGLGCFNNFLISHLGHKDISLWVECIY